MGYHYALIWLHVYGLLFSLDIILSTVLNILLSNVRPDRIQHKGQEYGNIFKKYSVGGTIYYALIHIKLCK